MKRVLFFLGHLDDRDVEWMVNNGKKQTLTAGEKLIRRGISIDSLYIVLSGRLSVCTDGSTNKEIASLGTGEIVGEMSFLESRAPSVSVIALKESEVFKISRQDIELRFLTHPDFRANFYFALALFLSNRLRKTTDQLGYGLPEEEDLIDTKILDGVAQAGSRFGQFLHKFSEV